jgi:hypothetical protein
MRQTLRPVRLQVYAVVLVHTDEQWAAVQLQFPNSRPGSFRGREFLSRNWGPRRVVLLRVGEGVILSAATAQFGIDRWEPEVLMSTLAAAEADGQAVRTVATMNGVRLVEQPIAAANLEDSVPLAIAASKPQPSQQPTPEPAHEPDPQPQD